MSVTAFFNWMVAGLKRLKERGRFCGGQGHDRNDRKLPDRNNPVLSFIQDQCVVESLASVAKKGYFNAYKSIARSAGFGQSTFASLARNSSGI